MAIQIRSFVFVNMLSFLITFSLFTASMAGTVVTDADGGDFVPPENYRSLNASDPAVVAVGQFAVDEYNKASKKAVKFDSVIWAAGQTFGGNNYEFAVVIKGEEGNVAYRYSAIVLDKKDSPRKLLGFKRSV
ncbi:OLC1v1019535C1 [Oldenlandia corymbosa var. corymbosa]|uniref:OLC1v1019535C1 n=1 Tax=Oldenlandia corymbosa var. corymbosa TaxID=529605 RepID=A0AAV1EEB1_OLDCO|nr:OLC1v1019535C1 [Oldenlandia corymbosa var. corymbosa]